MPVRILIGTRLGPYEIVAPIGAGGMGEVYKARDTRLDRSVAIKILPPELAQNAEFKLRFQREARAISQLNHPYICTVYDVGEQDGTNYLVMELLEGESLADRLVRGPLPIGDVLKFGAQIATALDRAHHAGIVHRDLKPANVMITKSGAKLLDFGLAKSSVIKISEHATTEQQPLTREGTILGTFQYMSPEQLEGHEVDTRTDIFALGALLYEMATGHRAFQAKTKTSLFTAIMKEHPRPIAELQPLTPPALQHVVDKCLAKDADERWQSARGVASELQWIGSAGSQAGLAAPITGTPTRRRRLFAALAMAGWAIAIAAIVVVVMYASRLRVARQVMQTELAVSIDSAWNAPLAVSPDGRRLAILTSGRTPQLSIRDLSTGEGKLIAGTEGATYPFWAPDGHAIGFFSGGKLRTVNADTAAIQIICDAPSGRGGSWSPLGVIVFAPNLAPIMKVSENGGVPVVVTKLEQTQLATHRLPTFLPDGRHFLYSAAYRFSDKSSITLRAGSIDGGFDRKVLDYGSISAVVNGFLLTVHDHNLIAQQFDPDDLVVKGKPVAIAKNIDRVLGEFAVGAETLVYLHAEQPKRQLLRLDRPDTSPVVAGDAADFSLPAVSPDGHHVIVNRLDAATSKSDLWMVDLGGGPAVRLTFTAWGSMEDTGLFSPDGRRVALMSLDARGDGTKSRIQPAAGGTQEALIPPTVIIKALSDWSRDGKTVLVCSQRPETGFDIEVVHLDGDRTPVPLIHGPGRETFAHFSPDKKWIAYQSDESGRSEVYVTNYPSAAAKWQVTTEGGSRPFWSADGRQIYYLVGDRVFVAAVHEGDSFQADVARPVGALGDHIQDFTVAQNGRIVALREIDPGKPPLTVVANWEQLVNGRQ